MDKIKIEICCGTACYLLGAQRLMELQDNLPEVLKDKVEIEAKACLGLCNSDRLGGAPFVRLGGSEIVSRATPEEVIARLYALTGIEAEG